MNYHDDKRMKFFDFPTLFGIAVIIAGTVLLLDNVFGINLRINVWDFWPLILIALGLGQVMRPPESRQLVSGAIFLIIGALFLGNNLDLFYFRFSDVWPIILILIGLAILRHSFSGQRDDTSNTDFINLSFIIGGGDYKFTSKNLQGGKVSAVMGGGTIDLRDADMMQDQIVFDLFALWGGIELVVPDSWEVVLQGTPIMGGMEDKSAGPKVSSTEKTDFVAKKMIIRGTAIMGGVEVKN